MSTALRALPRTRTFQRRRPWRAWWIATVVAIALNLAVVVVLSQISKLHYELPQTPILTRRIETVPPPPPPPPAIPEPVQQPRSEPLAVALPPLALPAQPTPSTLALPDLPILDINRDLPLTLPAFTTIAPSPTALPDAGTIAIGEPDQGAELEAVFDLERFYPRAARLRGITGQSRVSLFIDATGVVTAATVLESQPAGVFDRATEELGRNLRFRPAQTDGKPVPSRKVLVIDWTLK